MRYADNSVGSIMEFEVITVRPEATLVRQRYLRRLGKMPENTEVLFVTTRNKLVAGRYCRPFCSMMRRSGWGR